METQIKELENQLENLQAKRYNLEEIAEQRKSRARELREAAEHKRAEELDVLKKNLAVLEVTSTVKNVLFQK